METIKIQADTQENAELYAGKIRERGIKVLVAYSADLPVMHCYCKTARDKRNVNRFVAGDL